VNGVCVAEDRHMAGSCERGDEPAGCIKCSECVDRLRNCQLLKHCAPYL